MDTVMKYFAIFVCIGLLVDQSAGQCDSSWSGHNSFCYYATRTGEEAELTWHEARQFCLSHGAELTSVHSQDEHDHIIALVQQSFEGFLWIGLNTLEDPSADFKWSDGTALNYNSWASGQPVDQENHRCTYLQVAEFISDCFDRRVSFDALYPLMDSPDDADGIDTFSFGKFPEDEAGVEQCQESCRNREGCYVFTFHSNFQPLATLKGQCFGATKNVVPTGRNYIYSTSGTRVPCKQHRKETGNWFNYNCGLERGVVCKKPETSYITPPTTALVDSYCPENYFRVGNGNKCYRVEVFESAEPDGGSKTWDEAVMHCREGPGVNPDLASVHSEQENSMIMSQIQGQVYGAWIGLHFQATAGRWLWADNSDLTYQNWHGSPGTGCAEIHATEESDVPGGKWLSRDCLARRGYVCQTYKDSDNPVVSPPATTPHDCPSGWTSHDNACYLVITDLKTFEMAESHCGSMGGSLAAVHSSSDNAYIHVFMQGNLAAWIGYRQDSQGEYSWTDGTANFYVHWGPTGPGSGQGCVKMEANGTWTDTQCSSYLPSVCKIYKDGSLADLTTPRPVEGVCPSQEWLKYGSHCYYFNTEDSSTNWDTALTECKFLAGRNFPEASLASIHSHAESNMLVEELQRKQPGAMPWIGLTKPYSQASWRWNDSSLYDYAMWQPDQPNSATYPSCARLSSDTFAGTWEDQDCTNTNYYICKTPKAPTPTTPPLPPEGDQECPAGFVKYSQICFLLRPDDRKSWLDAQTACLSVNSDIASVHDISENYWLFKGLNNATQNPSGDKNVWLGGRKNGPLSEHRFYWHDGSGWVFDYWSYREPNDETGTENCLEMWLVNGEWNDHNCNHERGYVCKYAPESGEVPSETPPDNSGMPWWGVMLIVLAVGGVVVGVAFIVKTKFFTTLYSINTPGGGLQDKVVFNNPLSNPSSAADDPFAYIYDNAVPQDKEENFPNVKDGVLYFGSEA